MWRVRLKRRITEIWRKLSQLDARPGQIAAGFAIGVAAGLLPLNPSPVVVASLVAWLSKRNVIAAAAGGAAAILYTPLLPLIWLAEYRLGRWILPVRTAAPPDLASLWDVLHEGWAVYAAMCVGAIAITAPVAAFAYCAVKRLAATWARRRRDIGGPSS